MAILCEARGEARGPFPDSLLERVAREMRDHGQAPALSPAGLRLESGGGLVEIGLADDTFRVRIAAAEDRTVQRIRGAVLHLLDHAAEGLTGRIDWVGGPPPGTLPPNVIFATVEGIARVGATFLRIRLRSDGLASFAEGGMHFRLLLPPAGRAPVWPMTDARGRTVWPEGADALHTPAYTVVDLDPEAGVMTFDLHEHAGSLATDWAQEVAPGAEVALSGPGGGDFPPGDWILLAGDETALPAIRRILARSPAGRRGHAVIETGDPGNRMALEAPPGITVEWLLRGTGPGLCDAVTALPVPPAGDSRFVWFAAERSQVRRAKTWFRDTHGLSPAEGYFSAYWTAEGAP